MMLQKFADELWIADGPELVAAAGFHYPTRMAVARLANGDLFVWSPIALSESLQADIGKLGTVRHIIAPNTLHHVFIADWQSQFPLAKVHGAPGLCKKRTDIKFDADLGDAAAPDWEGEIDQVQIIGNLITTEVVFFHVKSGTVLVTDLLQQLPANWFSGWRAVVAKLDLMTEPEPKVPRKFRAAFTNRKGARLAVERVLAWPAQKVLMAHGQPVVLDAPNFLRRAFKWLI